MAKKKAGKITLTQLRAAVQDAAKTTTTKEARFAPSIVLRPGTIIGKQLRDEISLPAARALAKNLARSLSQNERLATKGSLTPAVLSIKDRIIVGIIDPDLGGVRRRK